MARRKIGRLAYGEYISSGSESIQVSRARLELFESVRRVYPRFLKKLSTRVFPFYRDLAEAKCKFWGIDGPSHLSPYELITQTSAASSGGHCADSATTIKKRQKLKAALAKWATDFHADRLWLKDDAVRTLRGWHSAPEWRKSLKWNPFYGHLLTCASTGEVFEFQYPGWETELLTWARYNQSIRERFYQELLQYEKRTRKLAESCGLVRAQQKYSPANFEWFVLHEFAGMSSTQIARDKIVGQRADPDSTILKGIKAAAKLVDWGSLREANFKPSRKVR